MPRAAAKPKPPKPPLNRSEVAGLCQRFLKDGAYEPRRDTMVLYKIMKQYPSRDFWLAYTLPFKLNAMFWFLGADGQAQLSRDWATFSLDMPTQPEYTLESTKVGEDVVIDKKPRTIAELLK